MKVPEPDSITAGEPRTMDRPNVISSDPDIHVLNNVWILDEILSILSCPNDAT